MKIVIKEGQTKSKWMNMLVDVWYIEGIDLMQVVTNAERNQKMLTKWIATLVKMKHEEPHSIK